MFDRLRFAHSPNGPRQNRIPISGILLLKQESRHIASLPFEDPYALSVVILPGPPSRSSGCTKRQ